MARSRQRGVKPLLETLSSTLSPGAARSILSAYSLTPESSTTDPSVVTSLSHLAQDMRYLYPTDALTSAWPASIRYHVSLPNPLPSHNSSAIPETPTVPSSVPASASPRKRPSLAHHAVDNMYTFRNYARYFDWHAYDRHLSVSDAMGEAWIAFISGHEPWPGAETSRAAHFGHDGSLWTERESGWMSSRGRGSDWQCGMRSGWRRWGGSRTSGCRSRMIVKREMPLSFRETWTSV